MKQIQQDSYKLGILYAHLSDFFFAVKLGFGLAASRCSGGSLKYTD